MTKKQRVLEAALAEADTTIDLGLDSLYDNAVFVDLVKKTTVTDRIIAKIAASEATCKAIVAAMVSSGLVVGNCPLATISKSSLPTAQINFVPPASKLPYNFLILSPFMKRFLLFIIGVSLMLGKLISKNFHNKIAK